MQIISCLTGLDLPKQVDMIFMQRSHNINQTEHHLCFITLKLELTVNVEYSLTDASFQLRDYQFGGFIAVQLTSCLTGLDSTKHINLLLMFKVQNQSLSSTFCEC